jgi:restriction system protein
MASFEDRQSNELNPVFVGRERELEWLSDFLKRRRGAIVIAGPAGVGKTTLVTQFLASVRVRHSPLVLNTRYHGDAMIGFGETLDELYRRRDVPEIVVIDDAEALDERQLSVITDRVLNLKAVRTLILVTRRLPAITRAEVLELQPFSASDAQKMLRSLLGTELPPEDISRAFEAASGFPLALALLAEFVRGRDLHEIQRLIRGEIYDLNRDLVLPERKLITDVKPSIMLANEALFERLRRQPDSIYDLPSRKFEELVADLLADLGYEVELTPATRDGGKDILAYMTTPHGRLLCLVEAKKYRRDRTVGVELVRQLYGTLADADASSAMLVTTSSFSPDAKAFQQRHQYKLALRDYGNIVQWIEEYNRNRSTK